MQQRKDSLLIWARRVVNNIERMKHGIMTCWVRKTKGRWTLKKQRFPDIFWRALVLIWNPALETIWNRVSGKTSEILDTSFILWAMVWDRTPPAKELVSTEWISKTWAREPLKVCRWSKKIKIAFWMCMERRTSEMEAHLKLIIKCVIWISSRIRCHLRAKVSRILGLPLLFLEKVRWWAHRR